MHLISRSVSVAHFNMTTIQLIHIYQKYVLLGNADWNAILYRHNKNNKTMKNVIQK